MTNILSIDPGRNWGWAYLDKSKEFKPKGDTIKHAHLYSGESNVHSGHVIMPKKVKTCDMGLNIFCQMSTSFSGKNKPDLISFETFEVF